MKTEVHKNYIALSEAVSDKIIEAVKENPSAVLCLATGKTPVLAYELLVKKALSAKVSFSNCMFIQLDEWIGISPKTEGSCYDTLNRQLFKPLSISATQIIMFNALTGSEDNECMKMNEAIKNLEGIDLMLVGVGMNGHIGFNEPGTDFETATHVSILQPATIESGLKKFPGVTISGKGFTLGLKNVLDTKLLLVVANGEEKADILQQGIIGEITTQVPVSVVRHHTNAILMLDEAAASLLHR